MFAGFLELTVRRGPYLGRKMLFNVELIESIGFSGVPEGGTIIHKGEEVKVKETYEEICALLDTLHVNHIFSEE